MAKKDQLVLGIDLGGTKILTSVVNPQGEMLSRNHTLTPAAKGPEGVIQAILESSERALEGASIGMDRISAVGVGAPGLADTEAGILYTSPNLPGWEDVPLRGIVQEKLKKRTFLINDANAAALGEYYFGAAKGISHFIYVTISTGIGGGIVADGRLLNGSRGLAGEIGHMTIADKGPLCHCGNRGCWEALASGTALAKEAQKRIETGAETAILGFAKGRIDKVTAQTVQAAAEKGDPLANELILKTAYYFGVGLASLVNIFNPEMIVIGGGLSNMGDRLLKPAYQEAGERAFDRSFRMVRFVRAALGRNSGVLGAAAFALDEVRRTSVNLKRKRPESGRSSHSTLKKPKGREGNLHGKRRS
ncbi:MAG: ROK family protein [Planctomycetaceae bacterium]